MRIINSLRPVIEIFVLVFGLINASYANTQPDRLMSIISRPSPSCNKAGVVLRARVLNPEATLYEYIYMDLTLTNNSPNSVQIGPLTFDYGGYLDYALTDSNRQPICYMLISSSWPPGSLTKLNPGEYKSAIFCINDLFCWPLSKPLPMLPQGRYHLSLNLHAIMALDNGNIDTDLIIDDIPFDIVDATGDNASALQLFELGLARCFDEGNPDGANICMREILDKYSATPYFIQASQFLLSARKGPSPYLNEHEVISLRQEVLIKRPTHPYNIGGNIQNLIPLLSKSEMIDLYKRLKLEFQTNMSIDYIEMQYPWVKGELIK